MSATLDELASRFDCRLIGDPGIAVSRVATLATATPEAVSFLANPLYRDALAATRAGVVVLDEASSADCPVACLVCDNPYARYAEIASFLHPPQRPEAGIDPAASVAATASVADSASIDAGAVVGPGAVIGDRVVVGAGTIVAAGAVIGADTRLQPRATVLERVRVGQRCIVHAGVVLGADGFGFAQDGGRWIKVPQLGTVRIGDDVEIGANTTVDRGTIDDTVIGEGVKLDNHVQIAHNVHVGAHTVMAAMSGMAGSTRCGKRCMFGGAVITVGHLSICDDVMFTFASIVTKSVTKPGVYGGSLPAEEASKWRRNAARFRQLDAMQAQIKALAKQLEELKGRESDHD
jgi:UDP-3-O-[3-hydroxymyristoyl] glucosamine N-acyltransferase